MNGFLIRPINGTHPCFNCTEKFIYCHGQCPKDKRGEYGYEAWRVDLEKAKKAKKEYEYCHFNKYR